MDAKFIKRIGIKKIGLISIFFLAVLAVIVYATLPTWDNPTSCSPQTGNPGWVSCAFADSYDNSHTTARAVVTSTSPTIASVWRDFNFNIPSSNAITGVVVRLDVNGSTLVALGQQKPEPSYVALEVRLSKDGGATWGPLHRTPFLGDVEQTYLIDTGTDYTWTPADFSNSNFRVEVTCKYLTGYSSSCDLDWVSVQVAHKAESVTISIPIPTKPTLAFVSDETVLQRGDWLHTEEQFVAHQGNPSQYTMMRNGAVTGISIHCERAPSSCSSNPTVEARITAGGNVPPSTTPVISVALPNDKYAAYNVVTPGTSFNAGDTISVYAQDYGTCTAQPAWCTVLVETSMVETITVNIPVGGVVGGGGG